MRKYFQEWVDANDVNYTDDYGKNLLMQYFAHVRPIQPQIVNAMLGKKEHPFDKWGFGPTQKPSYMRQTINSKIKIKNYDPNNEKKFKKVFPIGESFF